MEKRVFLALFLSFLVLFGYQTFFVKPAPKRAPGSAAAGSTTTIPAPAAQTSAPVAPAGPPPTAEAPPAAPLPQVATLVGDTAERDVRVDTDLVSAVFTTRGAALKSWKLKKFHDLNKHPLELVPPAIARPFLPFMVYTDDPESNVRLQDALFKPSTESLQAAAKGATLTFDFQNESGLRATKTFRFEPDSYLVVVTVNVTANGKTLTPRLSMGAGLGDPADASARGTKQPEALMFVAGKARRVNVSGLAKQSEYQGDFGFAGVEDQYFVSSVIRPGPVTVRYEVVAAPTTPTATPPATPAREFVAYHVSAAQPPAAGYRVYIGPKAFETLQKTDADFPRAIDFGIFAFLVVPLLRSLKWINAYVGNYGWSIVLLTVFINALMFPLRHKSVVSMRKMQEIQPQVKAIQDRYGKMKATDPERQKMNTELMNLYREKGVNPASGCIPMLLTLPVLYAFYSLLAGAIEIRGEPFIGWIHDLSSPDPLYITPIAMAITMFIQQKMTPSTADPAQQRMMLIMPLMLGFLFLRASSGLVLYWLVSNVWAIGQQYLTNRIIGPPVVRAARPPAERRVRPAGSPPKTA